MASPPRKRPTRADGVKRRDELLDAALLCFFEAGVAQTRVEDIRRRADASPSSLYHQFGGLSDVLLALLIRTFERLFAHLGERVAAETGAKAQVMALVDGHLEWVFAHRQEATVMYQAMALRFSPEDERALTAAKMAALVPVATTFSEAMANGTLPPMPPLLLEVVAMGSTHEACRRFLGGAPLSPEWMRTHLPSLGWASVWAANDSAAAVE